ncbi:MAG: TadE/TadG family type IV pilus assembly protein, partial [Polyangiales bacterium]
MRISSLNFLSRLGHANNDDVERESDFERESLRSDESGAMMVIGLFMAVFLVGMLYYIVGLGDAIAYRERMQDTSDVGSFTAAVVNARGMNLIVMLNM